MLPPARRSNELRAAVEALRAESISPRLADNMAVLTELLAQNTDLTVRPFRTAGEHPSNLIFLRGLVPDDVLSLAVLGPLTTCRLNPAPACTNLASLLKDEVLLAGEVELALTIGDVIDGILGGEVAVLVEGCCQALRAAIPDPKGRAVEEPVSESVIRGPREGFTEQLNVNTALLRRRLRSPYLKMETIRVGRTSRTRVVLVYLQDVVNPGLVAEVRRRLTQIDTDAILDAGYIEELIEDNPSSFFPQVQNTERPDVAAGNLVEGRAIILTDTSPFALIVPTTFWGFLQSSEDYYERFPMSTFLRLLRVFLAFIALLGPALWIALITFHQEMFPTALLMTVASSRVGIPFPAVVEALLMEIFFEALREAGVRLPRPVGQAVSIVGALVIGQAAVQAGIVSAPKVIVVAATGIASFSVPRFSFGIALRLCRFLLMLMAANFGLFGIMLGLMFLLFHLASLRSCGVPYLQPFAPLTLSDLKDTVIRVPRWLLDRRPESVKVLDRRRQAPGLRPGPTSRGDGT